MTTGAPGEAHWRRVGSRLEPLAPSRGAWDVKTIHGRLLSALAARQIELDHGGEGRRCARLTVDLLRVAPFAPLEIVTEPIREGRTLRAVDALLTSEGRLVARATAILLREGEQPPSEAWQAPEWDAPPPLELTVDTSPEGTYLPLEVRPVTPGGFRAAGRKRLWLREQRPLVEGEGWTPLVRTAAAADLVNATANSGTEANWFVNADLSLHLGRRAAGEWIGLDVAGHVSEAGVATAWSELYDERGRLGTAAVSSVASARQIELEQRDVE
ncbi:MAG: thioesterase family protein [Actinobacteria bacterium]|nr:thioesterase family protein [Actinomycetota bacterium]